MGTVADWGVLPHRMRAAVPQLQDCSHVGMQGPALLDVKSTACKWEVRDTDFYVVFYNFKYCGGKQNTLVHWLQAMGFLSVI